MDTPDYIPTHLVGRVSDFREEADGRVSFTDIAPDAGGGAQRSVLNKEDFRKTFNETDRINNPEDYRVNAYGTGPQNKKSLQQMITDTAGGWVNNGMKWSAGGGALRTGATAAALAATLAGGYKAFGKYRDGNGAGSSLGSGLKTGIGAAALAALATAGYHAWTKGESAHDIRKEASYGGSQSIADMMQGDMNLSFQQKADMLRAIGSLTANDRYMLTRMLSTVSGAAIGATISRFLLGKSPMGMLMGGLMGGAVGGYMSSPKPIRNFYGQISNI